MSDSRLFQPFRLGQLALDNRIVIAPMCQYSARDGHASEWHLMHFGQMMQSGAGLFIIEATAVEPEGRISAEDLGLWSDEHASSLAATLEAVRRHSAMPVAIQLGHAGRKASVARPWEGGTHIPPAAGGWQTVAPSAQGHASADTPPQALDAGGLSRVRAAFADAARRAEAIGIDAVELHMAHGYLLHQFLSPLANTRDDAYGGDLASRMRFPLEVFDAVRAVLSPGKPLGVRISATDWVDGGWDLAQSIELARALKSRGAAYIHVSSGGLSTAQTIPTGPGYQLPFADALRKAVPGLPVIAVGLITEARHAERILQSGQADLIALARAMLYDPRWPWHAAAELGARLKVAPQYLRCAPHGLHNLSA
ncbi:NADH:flavin oxidoreductase/NADH oxidase [Methyloversatilis thermotolerans]|uniref:NADH:flavin oxidoreductase/NADH oxidase n=1 Tax=Methyloversatilis thermotolerans TaxID=1346290 RepID=UPI00036DD183|nr:NADH:flavin oxidoreductase/NADH oxidase [Methyloversatilis thermotolerans]